MSANNNIEKNTSVLWRGDVPFSSQFGDVYFSEENGLEESRYVFLEQNGLPKRWKGRQNFVVAELGFGAGLNFLLTWKLWRESGNSGRLHYISFEKYPLSTNQIKRAISPWEELGEYCNRLCESLPVALDGFHRINFDDGNVSLTLVVGDIDECLC